MHQSLKAIALAMSALGPLQSPPSCVCVCAVWLHFVPFSRCTSLVSLQLVNVYLESDTLQVIADTCPHLQKLTLTGRDRQALQGLHAGRQAAGRLARPLEISTACSGYCVCSAHRWEDSRHGWQISNAALYGAQHDTLLTYQRSSACSKLHSLCNLCLRHVLYSLAPLDICCCSRLIPSILLLLLL